MLLCYAFTKRPLSTRRRMFGHVHSYPRRALHSEGKSSQSPSLGALALTEDSHINNQKIDAGEEQNVMTQPGRGLT